MEYVLHILIIIGIYIILTLSLNLVVGFTGLPSLGHAAFYCTGAYVSALATKELGLSPWFGLVLGALSAMILGIIIGLPSLRLKGDYFALATFGFAIIVYSIIKNWVSLTNGSMGLSGIPQYSFYNGVLSGKIVFFIIVSVLSSFTIIIISRITNSPFGRILRSIREDETASKILGKETFKYKISAFCISAMFAGIAGSLYAHYISFIDPSSFTVMESITILLMVILGGMGSVFGSVVGAVTLVLFPEILRFIGLPSPVAAQIRQVIYGLLLIILMIKKPFGVFGRYRLR